MSSFLLQGAADPEHPNKHPGTPHPVRVDLHNFEESEWTKNWKSWSLPEPNSFDIKKTFVYEIRRPFGERRRRKCENIQQTILNILKYYSKLFIPLTQIQVVAHSENSNKF